MAGLPPRCFNCLQSLPPYSKYQELYSTLKNDAKVLEKLGLDPITRGCCRRMLMTHIDLNCQLLIEASCVDRPLVSIWNPAKFVSQQKKTK